MKKIISLFKRDYEGNRRVYDEVVPGAEWVLDGEGVATEKFDGTACMFRGGILYKRYDRKLTKAAARRKRKAKSKIGVPELTDFKPAPEGWEPIGAEPDFFTGHWPGWLEVDFDKPENKWHKEAWENIGGHEPVEEYDWGITCELVGPKIQGNPYGLDRHEFCPHDMACEMPEPPRDFDGLRDWLRDHRRIEGIVWHHPDGRLCKVKRSDFGFDWPIKEKFDEGERV